MKTRRNHLPGFKAQVALAASKGDKTLAERAERFDVPQNQIQAGKKQLLDQAESVFGRSQEIRAADEAPEKDLHAKIGALTLENDFLPTGM